MGLHDQELNSQEMEQAIQEREIDNEFVVVDKSLRGNRNSNPAEAKNKDHSVKHKSLQMMKGNMSELRNSQDQVKAIRKSYLAR